MSILKRLSAGGRLSVDDVELLVTLMTLPLSVLAALGALIYAERLIFMSERTDKYPRRTRLGHIWAGMGFGKWIGLALFAAALWWTLR